MNVKFKRYYKDIRLAIRIVVWEFNDPCVELDAFEKFYITETHNKFTFECEPKAGLTRVFGAIKPSKHWIDSLDVIVDYAYDDPKDGHITKISFNILKGDRLYGWTVKSMLHNIGVIQGDIQLLA